MSWRPIPQEICLANLSILPLKTPGVVSATEKLFPAISRRYSAQKQKYFGGIPQDTAFILKILCEGTLPNNLWRATVYQTNFEWKYLPNKFQRKPLPKSIWKNMPTKENLKRNLYEQKIWRENSPQKIVNNFSTKNYLEKFYQGNSEETFPAKKIEEQSLPKHLFQETFPYHTNWRNISTKNHLKKNLYQKEWRNISTKKFQEKI